jgi:1-deoxy-D-xylulose-5-phosphate synthase
MDRAGIVGEDGATHQGMYDIAYLRTLPNMVVMAPKDENELRNMLKTAVDHTGPAAIRYPRGAGLGVELDAEMQALEIGKGEVLREGNDIAIFAYGHMVSPAEQVADMLENEGLSVAVINARFVKPIDKDLIARYARSASCIVTVEEHALQGGFGSAVLEAIHEEGAETSVKCIGVPDIVLEHGAPGLQRKDLKLDPQGLFETMLAFYDTVCQKAASGNGKRWYSGNGKKPFMQKVKKSPLEIKQSANG